MTDTQIWSWIVTIVGIIGFIIAGRKVWWSWYVNLGAQALWVVYALISSQPAFLVSAAIYAVVFGRNAYIWTRDRVKKPRIDEPAKADRVRIMDIDKGDISFGGIPEGGKVPDWFVQAFNRGDIQVGRKNLQNVLYINIEGGEVVANIGDWVKHSDGRLYVLADPLI